MFIYILEYVKIHFYIFILCVCLSDFWCVGQGGHVCPFGHGSNSWNDSRPKDRPAQAWVCTEGEGKSEKQSLSFLEFVSSCVQVLVWCWRSTERVVVQNCQNKWVVEIAARCEITVLWFLLEIMWNDRDVWPYEPRVLFDTVQIWQRQGHVLTHLRQKNLSSHWFASAWRLFQE